MPDYKLLNPKDSVESAYIYSCPHGYQLAVRYKAFISKSDPYLFKTDVAAKKYYSTRYQSVKYGLEKPKWEKLK